MRNRLSVDTQLKGAKRTFITLLAAVFWLHRINLVKI